MSTCARQGCDRPAKTRGYCKSHYVTEMKTGRMTARTEWERFWEKVDVEPAQCWQWTATTAGRYGQFVMDGGQRIPAHRYAWQALVGPITDGLVVDHLCRNKLCVNPDHLEPVPERINTLRGVAPSALNARKARCKNGHDDWVHHATGRRCRTCHNEYYRAYRKRAA